MGPSAPTEDVCAVDEEVEYTELDWQLLFELRISLILGKPLPLPVLRVMRARGWVFIPPQDLWVHVRAAMEGSPEETIEAFSYHVAVPKLTATGVRELHLHSRHHDDDFMEDILESEFDDGAPVDDDDDAD